MAKGHRPAGGIASRVTREIGYRSGPGAKGVNKNWVSQTGQSLGNHITEKSGVLRGVPAAGPYGGASFNPVEQGNKIAAATVCKPGGSRNRYPQGSQGKR